MSVKVLSNIKHNNDFYKNGDIITEITKEDALRLVDLEVAEIVDDKFKQSKKDIKNNVESYQRRKKKNEDEYAYANS